MLSVGSKLEERSLLLLCQAPLLLRKYDKPRKYTPNPRVVTEHPDAAWISDNYPVLDPKGRINFAQYTHHMQPPAFGERCAIVRDATACIG